MQGFSFLQGHGILALNVLTLSASSFIVGNLSGTVIGNIQNTTIGSTLSTTDSRVVIDSSNRLLVGLIPATTNFNIDIIETLIGVPNSPKTTTFTITVNSAGVITPLVSNTRLSITSAGEVVGGVAQTNADTVLIAASSSGKTKPSVTINASATRTFFVKVGSQANGSLIDYICNTDDPLVTYVHDYSDNTTDGVNGSWTTVTTLNYRATTETAARGAVNPFPTGSSGRYLRIAITNGTASAITVRLGYYAKPASGSMDLTAILGDSITIGEFQADDYEAYIKTSVDSTRDPIIVNLAVHGFSTVNMLSTLVPLLSTAIAAGVPFSIALYGTSVNDVGHSRARPESTDPNASDIPNHTASLTAGIVTAGIPESMHFFRDMTWLNYINPPDVPAANTVALADNGIPPYNRLLYSSYLKGRSQPVSVSTAMDTFYLQQMPFSFQWMEDFASDGTTHPLGSFYLENRRGWNPAQKYLSGLPTGQGWLEEEIVKTNKQGISTLFHKQRLMDNLAQLPSTSDVAATAIRNQASSIINSLNTSGYSNPGGIVAPSGRSGAPSLWLCAADQDKVTYANSSTIRMSQIADKSSNAFTFSQATVGNQPFYLANHSSTGRGLYRCRTSLGFMNAVQASATTIIDPQADFSIELMACCSGIGSSPGAFVAGSNWSIRLSSVLGPLNISITSSGLSTTFTPTPEVPFYLLITYIASTHVWTAFVNGVSVGTVTFTKPLWTSTVLTLLATVNGTVKSNDDVYELAIYPFAFTAQDKIDGLLYAQTMWATP